MKCARLAYGILACLMGTAIPQAAQEIKDLQTPMTPLVLKAQGSFYVGGERVAQTEAELGSFGPAGHITVNQMYVRYMVPPAGDRNAAVVMIHGMTLTGKTWETTPDGRMGWDEYFVRKEHPVYVVDQVSRGRSGFNQAVFNSVRTGATQPGQLPPMRRFSDEVVWPNFRFGPKPGTPYPDEQFPVASVDELSKQSIPDLNSILPAANPSYNALAHLSSQLKRTVLMGHSQGGRFPLETALVNPMGIAGLVLVEPGSCPAGYTDQQIATLAKIPILVVFGDHLADAPTGIATLQSWQAPFDGCRAFITRVNGAGGQSQMLYPPDHGIRGNSHMIMQDRNNLQIADLILKWIDEKVEQRHITAFTGTWKFNLAKSRFNPGPPFRNFTMTFTPDGTRHLDLIGADGQPFKASLPWSDGKEVFVSVTEGAMQNVTATSSIKGRTFDDIWMESGRAIEKVHGVLSPDGKTMTVTVEGPLPKGGAFHNEVVFDKQ